MRKFRLKLAAILLSSDLNKRKGCPLYKSDQPNEANTFSEVEVFETPPISNKRKLCPHIILHDDSKLKDTNDEIKHDVSPTPPP